MRRLMQLRFAAIVLIAAAVVSLTAASAWAFSQENLQPGGTGNSTFADPDDQFTNSTQGAHPFGPNGPVVQFGVQQGPLTPYGRLDGNGYTTSPPDHLPDPYYRPLGNGN
jgi:hypothetical protein